MKRAGTRNMCFFTWPNWSLGSYAHADNLQHQLLSTNYLPGLLSMIVISPLLLV